MICFLYRPKQTFVCFVVLIVFILFSDFSHGQALLFPAEGKWMGSGATQFSDGTRISYFEFFSIKNGKVRGRQINQERETEYIKWDFEPQADQTLKTSDGLVGSCIDLTCTFELVSDSWKMQTVWTFNDDELVRTETGSFGQLNYRQISKLKKQK